MTRYDFFESGMGLIGVKLATVPAELLARYDAYKTFLEHLNDGLTKPEAIATTAKECKCDKSTIARYIYWFERDDEAFQDQKISVVRSGRRWKTLQIVERE